MKLYQMIRENGGWDMFRMIEIEKYPCNDRREAEKRENEVMKSLKASMNSIHSVNEVNETRKLKIKMKQYEDYTHRLKHLKWCDDNKEEVKILKSLFD